MLRPHRPAHRLPLPAAPPIASAVIRFRPPTRAKKGSPGRPAHRSPAACRRFGRLFCCGHAARHQSPPAACRRFLRVFVAATPPRRPPFARKKYFPGHLTPLAAPPPPFARKKYFPGRPAPLAAPPTGRPPHVVGFCGFLLRPHRPRPSPPFARKNGRFFAPVQGNLLLGRLWKGQIDFLRELLDRPQGVWYHNIKICEWLDTKGKKLWQLSLTEN